MQDAALEPPPPGAESSGTHTRAEADPRLAQLPAHLQVRRVIGAGGSSVVYEAFHARLKVPVALKLLSVRDAQARQRMRREAELYALLEDARIPRVYDVDELPDGTPYVIMEMVPGQSLADLLDQRGALPCRLAINIAQQVLAILVAVHARGVLHRDVKPANVLLNPQPDGHYQLRLVDFGIAKLSTHAAEAAALTQRGALIGTPQYMAPERLVGEAADATADTYAVGVMLYEMLAGVVPFAGASVSAIVVAVLREQPKPLLEHRPELPPALEQLVERAMARTPGARFGSAEEMLQQLSAIERALTLDVSVLEPAEYADSRASDPAYPPTRALRGFVPAGRLARGVLLGVLALAAAGWVAWVELRPPAPLAVEATPALPVRPAQATAIPRAEPGESAARADPPPRAPPRPTPPVVSPSAHEQAATELEPPVPAASEVDRTAEPALPAANEIDRIPEPDPRLEPTLEQLQPPEQRLRRGRRTTIDYAELLPDNPY